MPAPARAVRLLRLLTLALLFFGALSCALDLECRLAVQDCACATQLGCECDTLTVAATTVHVAPTAPAALPATDRPPASPVALHAFSLTSPPPPRPPLQRLDPLRGPPAIPG